MHNAKAQQMPWGADEQNTTVDGSRCLPLSSVQPWRTACGLPQLATPLRHPVSHLGEPFREVTGCNNQQTIFNSRSSAVLDPGIHTLLQLISLRLGLTARSQS